MKELRKSKESQTFYKVELCCLFAYRQDSCNWSVHDICNMRFLTKHEFKSDKQTVETRYTSFSLMVSIRLRIFLAILQR